MKSLMEIENDTLRTELADARSLRDRLAEDHLAEWGKSKESEQ